MTFTTKWEKCPMVILGPGILVIWVGWIRRILSRAPPRGKRSRPHSEAAGASEPSGRCPFPAWRQKKRGEPAHSSPPPCALRPPPKQHLLRMLAQSRKRTVVPMFRRITTSDRKATPYKEDIYIYVCLLRLNFPLPAL